MNVKLQRYVFDDDIVRKFVMATITRVPGDGWPTCLWKRTRTQRDEQR